MTKTKYKNLINNLLPSIGKIIIEHLLNELKNGEFDLWAEELCDNIHNCEINAPTIKSFVYDFLECRLNEIDNKDSIFNI